MNAPDLISRLNAALEGRYRIESEVGEGGMATVFLAEDVKHERRVALKVLKPELAAVVGADRFLAEIKTTANLQHPHILPLFDSGEAGSFVFYVMPYVEGESLRERIEREKQLPVEESVAIAVAVSQALQHAHDRGVIHRDIKPGNILLQDGQPVVSDFGIALAIGSAGGARLTETGLSVGTPYYMSPEQATGDQQVGPSSDTYSLAAVLYEMLVGDPPYTGSTAQAVLGKIIQGAAVPVTEIRRTVPANVESALAKALEKIPADRFSSVRDFARALADPAFRHGTTATRGAVVDARRWKRVAAGFAVLFAVAASWTAWGLLSSEPEEVRPVVRVSSPFESAVPPLGQDIALSPDGRRVVFRAMSEDGPALFVRSWDATDAVLVRGTLRGQSPLISPDGAEVLFFRVEEGEARVEVVAIDGGAPRELLRGMAFPSAWGRDGFIYLWDRASRTMIRIPAEGGEPEPLVVSAEGRLDAVFDVLPGGRVALGHTMDSEGEVGHLITIDLRTKEVTRLGEGFGPQYVETGHVVFVSADTTMLAAPFDLDGLRMTRAPVVVEQNVWGAWISRSGTTLIQRGPSSESEQLTELVWVSRTGQLTPVDPGWIFDRGDDNAGWRLSPEGRRIAYRELRDGNYDIFIRDLDTGLSSRLTFHERDDRMPRWSEDGTRISFLSSRTMPMAAYDRLVDGTGGAELLFEHSVFLAQGFYAPGGEWLVLRTGGQANVQGGRDILAVRPGVDSVATPLLVGDPDYTAPAVSPDGRWLAYTSDEDGSPEVFVVPFPDVESGKWQVSHSGGSQPIWAHGGGELLYVNGEKQMVSVRFESGSGFMMRGETTLFTIPDGIHAMGNQFSGFYDISPDDERFLMGRNALDPEGEASDEEGLWTLVVNFDGVLRRLFGN